MNTCITCGKDIRTGSTGSTMSGCKRCLICVTNERLERGWRYPAAQSAQRKWRARVKAQDERGER